MADAPWRCSECGTVNEPVANACRTCGKWPSLFDLQESIVDEAEPDSRQRFTLEIGEPELAEVEVFEPETFEPDMEGPADPEPEPEGARRRRLITSVLVPLAFVVYLVISNVFGNK